MTVTEVVRSIRAFMRNSGVTEAQLSRTTGISQSTLNRSLKNPKRITKTHRLICKKLGILHESVVRDSEAGDALVQVLMDIWDGSPEHAAVIAKLLKAGSLLEAHGAIARGGKRMSHGRS